MRCVDSISALEEKNREEKEKVLGKGGFANLNWWASKRGHL